MTSKSLRHTLLIAMVVVLQTRFSQAGIIDSHHEKHEDHHHHQEEHHHEEHHHDHHKATSYMYFHGPVEGPEYEVKIPYFEHHHHEHEHEHHHHEHHHEPKYTVDYVAHPKYKYSYGIEDWHTGDFHSQKEERDGSSVTGEYTVAEPGGRLRVVHYRADKDGFHAEVHHHGKNDHSSYYHHHEHHPHMSGESSSQVEQRYLPSEIEQQQLMQEYQASFQEAGAGYSA